MKNQKRPPAYKLLLEIPPPVEIPYNVWTKLGIPNKDIAYIAFNGEQLQLGEGDFCTLEELRSATEWLVNQLGGAITWQSKK